MRRGWLWCGLLALLVGLLGCRAADPARQPRGAAPPAAEGAACIPYGALPAPVSPQDPVWGTPQPATPTPAPTCTPRPPSDAPGDPPPTPFPTPIDGVVRRAPAVSSAPQNLTLSPWDETLHHVASASHGAALTWQAGDGSHYLTLRGLYGLHTVAVQDVLGSNTPAAVSFSPAGRLYVAGGGAYAYSDDQGQTWTSGYAPSGTSAPHLLVQPDGYARLYWLSGDTLLTAAQQVDGRWDTPVPLAVGVTTYDAVRADAGRVTAAVIGEQVWLWHNDTLAAQLPLAATHAQLTSVAGVVTLGLGRHQAGNGAAWIVRSLDQGATWSDVCPVQSSAWPIGDVAAFPTTAGPYAVLWVWWQPLRDSSSPYIALSQVRFEDAGCAVVPGATEADGLIISGGRPPGLFVTRWQQLDFRLTADARFISYTGWGSSGARDLFTADLRPDGIFSGGGQDGVAP